MTQSQQKISLLRNSLEILIQGELSKNLTVNTLTIILQWNSHNMVGRADIATTTADLKLPSPILTSSNKTFILICVITNI
jgi:hypothetical protein